MSQELHERIEQSVKEALGAYYLAGQLAAMPEFVGRRPVPVSVTGAGRRLAGRRLRAGQQLTLDVSAEEMAAGEPFKRELLLGNFNPTDRIDYCDPRAGGHED